MKKLLFLLGLCSFSAQAQLSSYQYKQPLEEVKQSGWHSLTLPVTLFDRMHYLTDFRIYGISAKDTIEVPYLIDDWVTTTQTHTHFAVKNDKTAKRTLITLGLPEVLLLSKVAIHPAATYDYYRTVSIDEVARGVLSSKKENVYSFAPQRFEQLQISIYNQDNEPLEIRDITLFPLAYRLTARFPDTLHTYYLVYGKDENISPSYDIGHFVKDIPKQLPVVRCTDEIEYVKEAPTAATASLVSQSPTTNGSFVSAKPLLWAVMGLIVILIFIFASKMMRKN